MSISLGAILLGAGVGRRFGSDKRIARLGDRTVAETTIQRYQTHFAHLRVVVREADAITETLAAMGVEIVPAAEAHLGMGHSLAAGIMQCDWDYAFIGLLDMPFVRDATLKALISNAQEHPNHIIRPVERASGRSGHPVGFPCASFEALQQLTGDAGARSVVAAHSDLVVDHLTDDVGIIRDIDRPADIA